MHATVRRRRSAALVAATLAADAQSVRSFESLDQGMPSARAYAGVRPGLPVLFVSGYTADVIARYGMLATGIELEPFRVAELLARVRALLDSAAGVAARQGS